MAGEEKTCCSAEAMRRIRQIDISGHQIGLAMLDAILEEISPLNLLMRDVWAMNSSGG